ncbi:invasion associated locus B family protein [Pelagerythrobacter marensis]|uniref:Invasion associated locus B family protein n=1 Tax=Pelagerythrobacter marensis TaxID=543877 RepID=A0ABZ2D0P5_9SPHN
MTRVVFSRADATPARLNENLPRAAILTLALALLALAAPLAARDSLGVFSNWAAFRDPGVPRCYAIARPMASGRSADYRAFASVGTWPRRRIRGQIHFRLSRKLAPDARIVLRVGQQRFSLTGGGGDAWARDKRMDAAIVAAMRAAGRMTVSATDSRNRRFSDSYDLTGAATAMDAATVGCARIGRRYEKGEAAAPPFPLGDDVPDQKRMPTPAMT